jgi:CubicO group peptidase (beta-lactamase class C family)
MAPGLSRVGLARLHDSLAGHVERAMLPGLVALVSYKGDTHLEVIGTRAFGPSEPMGSDSLFRIASLTKPVAAAGAMLLVDEGKLRLHDAVDGLLPELADRRVLASLESELDQTVAASRPITVEDLLTFKLGFGQILAPPGTYPIQVAEQELDLAILRPPWPPPPFSSDEWIRRFATLPLMCQPGEQWLYNAGTMLLGILMERASGKSLDAFLTERIFEPLQMHDTGFSVPVSERARQTTAYAPSSDSGEPYIWDAVDDSYWSRPPMFYNASGWLVSTMDDFWVFVQMLQGGGEYGGHRILSRESVDLMTRDHLTRRQRTASHLFLGGHSGWGLGMAVPASGVESNEIPSGFGWNGGSGTTWRSDTVAGITGILFTQRAMTSPEPPEIFSDFWKGAYAAMADS